MNWSVTIALKLVFLAMTSEKDKGKLGGMCCCGNWRLFNRSQKKLRKSKDEGHWWPTQVTQKRPKVLQTTEKVTKDEQNDQNDNNTKLSKGPNKGHKERNSQQRAQRSFEKAFTVVVHDARENLSFFSTTFFLYQSFLPPQRLIIVFVAY